MHSRAFQLVLLRAKEVLSASFRPRGARSGPRSGSLARKNESFFLVGWRKRGSEERRRCRKQSSEQSEKKASEGKFHAGRKQLLPALPLPLPSPSRPARAARSWLRTRGTCLRVCGKERAREREGSARGREEERRGRRRESGGVKQKQKNTFFVACFARLLLHSNASHLRPTPPTPLARALSLRFVQFGVLMCFFAFQVCVIEEFRFRCCISLGLLPRGAAAARHRHLPPRRRWPLCHDESIAVVALARPVLGPADEPR